MHPPRLLLPLTVQSVTGEKVTVALPEWLSVIPITPPTFSSPFIVQDSPA